MKKRDIRECKALLKVALNGFKEGDAALYSCGMCDGILYVLDFFGEDIEIRYTLDFEGNLFPRECIDTDGSVLWKNPSLLES